MRRIMKASAIVSPMPTTTPKQQFLDGFKRETATTLKVIRAYPTDKLDFKPTAQS